MLRARLDGLTDEEFAWEQAAGAWTVDPDDRGMWIADYENPDPIPAPITTIGWRVVHVSEGKWGECSLTAVLGLRRDLNRVRAADT